MSEWESIAEAMDGIARLMRFNANGFRADASHRRLLWLEREQVCRRAAAFVRRAITPAHEGLIEARAALDMQPCLCRNGFVCSRCKGLAGFDRAGVLLPDSSGPGGDGLTPQPACQTANQQPPAREEPTP